MGKGVAPGRVTRLNDLEGKSGPVIYWMSRDQRSFDNWALLFARELSEAARSPLVVAFCLAPRFLGATGRAYGFMLDGLAEVEAELSALNIPFNLMRGNPVTGVATLVKNLGAAALVTDFDPLKTKRGWRAALARKLKVPFYEVDAHNIVPCREASGKREYGAYTIRPKINRLLHRYLTDFPALSSQKPSWSGLAEKPDWRAARCYVKAGREASTASGESAALHALDEFVEERLAAYEKASSDPNMKTSGLSPYLHFGQLSAQRVALTVSRSRAPDSAKESFLEELIVRRELSDNFCLHSDYDSISAFPDWARNTLEEHRADPREYIYSREQFERAETHDPLWNAAQLEMVRTGRMHNYMRMYWAKKILEWSRSPEEALATAINLNDRYELDGRDPNGYTGIAWSIGGVHDRAWKERAVFGKIRYMSYRGCRRKFDVDRYIETVVGPA